MATRAPRSTSATGYRLLIDDPRTVPISVIVSPPQSVLALLLRVASKRAAPHQPSRQRQRANLPLKAIHRASLEPLGSKDCGVILDAYAPIAPDRDVTVMQHVERVRDMPDSVLTSELAVRFGEAMPRPWVGVAKHPDQWRHSWASASVDAWSWLEPRWQARRRELDLELRRTSTAIARGATDALLNSLHPRLSYAAGELRFSTCRTEVNALSGRRLALVPMIGGDSNVIVSFDQPDLTYIAYPIPGRRRTERSPGHDQLALVLGPVRAGVLHALARPHTVGELAALLGVVPATMSYHCDALENAELVQRVRTGRRVVVRRTFRGDELTDLFDK